MRSQADRCKVRHMAEEEALRSDDMPVIDMDFDWQHRWCNTCQADTRHRITRIAVGNEFTLQVRTRDTCLEHDR